MSLRKLLSCAAGLLLVACAHRPASVACPPPPPPPNRCNIGWVALYFKPDEAIFTRPFTLAFGRLTEVADKCPIRNLVVTGLPDPNDPAAAGTLAGRRAAQVRDFFAAFDMPQPTFEYGDEEQRRKPAVAYDARRDAAP